MKSWHKAQQSENEDRGIWSHHFMEIDGETVETVRDFILGGSKITADGDCSYENAALNLPANLENSAVATGLEKDEC